MEQIMTKYAAIITDTLYHEGDERSRTHPGHGYPAYSESVEKFRKFKDYADMQEYVEEQTSNYSKDKYVVIQYEELSVVTTVTVVIK